MQTREVKTRRRVVTGLRDGRSAVLHEDNLPVYRFSAIPGFEHSAVWAAQSLISAGATEVDARLAAWALPRPGESLVQIVTFPPDAVRRSGNIDPQAAGAEYASRLPGLAETFEQDGSGMHTTRTLDYAILQDGEISLELDDGEIVDLRAGDIVVQQGVRHGWRNRGDKPATVLFVMLG